MEFKGTKGKWDTFNDRVEQKGQFEDIVICRFEPRMSMQSQYNALLISKAPEMLEMLNKLVDEFDFSNHFNDEDFLEDYSKRISDIKQLIKESTEL